MQINQPISDEDSSLTPNDINLPEANFTTLKSHQILSEYENKFGADMEKDGFRSAIELRKAFNQMKLLDILPDPDTIASIKYDTYVASSYGSGGYTGRRYFQALDDNIHIDTEPRYCVTNYVRVEAVNRRLKFDGKYEETAEESDDLDQDYKEIDLTSPSGDIALFEKQVQKLKESIGKFEELPDEAKLLIEEFIVASENEKLDRFQNRRAVREEIVADSLSIFSSISNLVERAKRFPRNQIQLSLIRSIERFLEEQNRSGNYKTGFIHGYRCRDALSKKNLRDFKILPNTGPYMDPSYGINDDNTPSDILRIAEREISRLEELEAKGCEVGVQVQRRNSTGSQKFVDEYISPKGDVLLENKLNPKCIEVVDIADARVSSMVHNPGGGSLSKDPSSSLHVEIDIKKGLITKPQAIRILTLVLDDEITENENGDVVSKGLASISAALGYKSNQEIVDLFLQKVEAANRQSKNDGLPISMRFEISKLRSQKTPTVQYTNFSSQTNPAPNIYPPRPVTQIAKPKPVYSSDQMPKDHKPSTSTTTAPAVSTILSKSTSVTSGSAISNEDYWNSLNQLPLEEMEDELTAKRYMKESGADRTGLAEIAVAKLCLTGDYDLILNSNISQEELEAAVKKMTALNKSASRSFNANNNPYTLPLQRLRFIQSVVNRYNVSREEIEEYIGSDHESHILFMKKLEEVISENPAAEDPITIVIDLMTS